MAQSMSKDAYKIAADRITADYTTEKASCDVLSGNTKRISALPRPRAKNRSPRLISKSVTNRPQKIATKRLLRRRRGDFAVANEKCDDKAGNDKDICVKEAKAIETRVKADAEAQLKTAEANKVANEKSAEAAIKARAERGRSTPGSSNGQA